MVYRLRTGSTIFTYITVKVSGIYFQIKFTRQYYVLASVDSGNMQFNPLGSEFLSKIKNPIYVCKNFMSDYFVLGFRPCRTFNEE